MGRSKRPRRRKMVVHREARCRPTRPNEAWSLDFVHDQLSNGQKLRALTIVDVFSRESLAIEVGQRLGGEHVVEVLNRLVRLRGAPRRMPEHSLVHDDRNANPSSRYKR